MSHLNRRLMLAGAAAAVPALAYAADSKAALGIPRSVISEPPRDFSPGAPPAFSPDPDILRVEPAFGGLLIGQEVIRRVHTGLHLAEGPAWSSLGLFAIFSDVKNDTLYRYIWETGEVTAFRKPSYSTNGNSFDFQGRQLSTQDFFRRVVRWEIDGSMTVIADSFEGKQLNSPNDLVAHPDGSIWFTDPPYGTNLSEGRPDIAGGPSNPDGVFNLDLGTEGLAVANVKRELPNGIYRWDPTGRIDLVINEDQLKDPNGLCFTKDYKTLLVCSTGRGPGEKHDGGPRTKIG